MMRLNILLAACSLAVSVSAQQFVIKTQIKGTDNIPVAGAIVSVPDQNISAITNGEGQFTLEKIGRSHV